ncbi:hypothetical protein EST62_11280 [Chlorobaculum sp. 24CR]|uniref:hypothetical protein n=1 Tax=Chlorobaculum sp. 24CR TaxID=2508878 RepID=UPI00100A5E62|nr:hypothetical protein [Chlorobaculum sp. 24CR]RXK82137.1 hypothetical protein EST62_11280 [Chlorobaculum sp. 24CR]
MKKEVKVAIIGGIVAIIVAVITGAFGYLNSRKTEPAPVAPAVTAPATQPATPPSQSVEKNEGNVTIINGDNNISAGGNVTIQGEEQR